MIGATQTTRFGMVVDINRCVGCQTCTISCKHVNDTPPGIQWRRVLDVERGTFPDVERLFLVTGCQHCAEPSCVPVCPTGATRQRQDGLVTMDYDTCIGCGYCAIACPYQARTIVHDKEWYYGEPTAQESVVAHDDRIGVANKCTFCIERIDDASVSGKTPGVDPDYTPACAASCIADALNFGNFADPDSNVSALVRDNANFQMHEELGNDPQIRYLYEVPNATPGRDPEPEDLSDETLSDPANPLVGARQTFWDYRAAMNFIMGGMSTGLAIAAYIAFLYGRADGDWLFPGMGVGGLQLLFLIAGIGMAVGLFFVFLEIGRKLRFLLVLRMPGTSWMTRETYVVALFYPLLAADLLWPHAALHFLVAASALAFLYCQGRILQAGKGIPAWRTSLMPSMLVATGLFEGFGLFALFSLMLDPGLTVVIPAFLGLGVFAVVNLVLWRRYRSTARVEGIGPLARREIDALSPYLHAIGHGLPIVCVIAAAIVGNGAAVSALLALAGAGAVVGGIMWKFTVITRACHQQGFAIPKMPRRGSGARAAPERMHSI